MKTSSFVSGNQLTSSISACSLSSSGLAFMNNLLCLLGDFDRHMMEDSSVTVSRYETTGSDFFNGIPAWSSSRSLRQISRCNSPAPAMMCSPDSSMVHCKTKVTQIGLSLNVNNLTKSSLKLELHLWLAFWLISIICICFILKWGKFLTLYTILHKIQWTTKTCMSQTFDREM